MFSSLLNFFFLINLMIIKNASVFSQDYVPEDVLYREKELNTIVMAIKGHVKGVKSHVFCYGTQGTGKTTVAKYLKRKLDEENIVSTYIDAKIINTKIPLLSEILRALKIPSPRRGIGADEILMDLPQKLKPIVVFLDETDAFKDKDFIYKLAKSENLKIMFIMISNVPSLSSIMQGISGIFATVEFKRYNPEQLKQIIKERAKLGLSLGSYDEDMIGKCAAFSAKHKANARAGIMLLFNSAMIAENEEKEKISAQHIETAKETLLNSLIDYDISTLSKEQQLILNELVKKQYAEIDEIAKLFPKLGERMVRNYLKELEEQGFIYEEEISSKGASKKVYRIKIKI